MERIADILSSNLSLNELQTIYYCICAIEMILFLPLFIPAAPIAVFWRRWFSTRKVADLKESDRHYWFTLLNVFTFLIWIPILIAAFEGILLLDLLQKALPNEMFMSFQSIWVRVVLLGVPMILSLTMIMFHNNVEKQ